MSSYTKVGNYLMPELVRARRESVAVPESHIATLLINSFRYCLGRRTYAVSECVEHIQLYWDHLPGSWQSLIKREILHALNNNKAGMDMDRDEWEKILTLEEKLDGMETN